MGKLGKTVLVVDDDQESRNLLSEVLGANGYPVLAVEGSEAVWEALIILSILLLVSMFDLSSDIFFSSLRFFPRLPHLHRLFKGILNPAHQDLRSKINNLNTHVSVKKLD